MLLLYTVKFKLLLLLLCQGVVQLCIAGVGQCPLRQSASLGAVYCQAHFRNRTPGVEGDTGPPSFSSVS